MRIASLKGLLRDRLIAPDHSRKVVGTLVLDDGISLNSIENNSYTYLKFNCDLKAKNMDVISLNSWDGPTTKSEAVNKISIFGAKELSSINTLCASGNGKSATLKGNYDSAQDMLKFSSPSAEIYWKDVKSVKFGSSC